MARKKFQIDRQEGKIMGVCAGIANYTGFDVTLIRVGLVVITFLGAFPWTLAAYGVAAWLGGAKSPLGKERREETRPLGNSAADVQDRMTDLDRRMAALDSYVAGTDSRLSQEIERLR